MIAVIDCIVVEPFLHVRGGSDKESFLVLRVVGEFLCTDIYEIINVNGLERSK